MLEYFAKTHSSLVHDISTLISDGSSVDQSKSKYDKKRIDKTLDEVASFAGNARSNVLAASIAISQSAGPNEFTAILTNIGKQLDIAQTRNGDISVESLSLLYKALDDVVALLSNEALKAQTDQSTFVDISEKLEVASSQIADAVVVLQDYLAVDDKKGKNKTDLTSKKGKKLSYVAKVDTVGSLRRAAYVAACCIISIYEQKASSPNCLVPEDISPSALKSAVRISKLISNNTPSNLRAYAVKIAINKFSAIRENCSKFFRLNQSIGSWTSNAIIDATSIVIKLAAEYARENSNAEISQVALEQRPDTLELLLLEGIFHYSYAAHLYSTSENTDAKIQDSLEAIGDSFRKCCDAYSFIKKSSQTRVKETPDVAYLQLLEIACELTTLVGSAQPIHTAKQQKKQSSFFSKHRSNPYVHFNPVQNFISSAVICALRSLCIILRTDKAPQCVWDGSILPLFPNELPRHLHSAQALQEHGTFDKIVSDKRFYSGIEKMRQSIEEKIAQGQASEREDMSADVVEEKEYLTSSQNMKVIGVQHSSKNEEETQLVLEEKTVNLSDNASVHEHTRSDGLVVGPTYAEVDLQCKCPSAPSPKLRIAYIEAIGGGEAHIHKL